MLAPRTVQDSAGRRVCALVRTPWPPAGPTAPRQARPAPRAAPRCFSTGGPRGNQQHDPRLSRRFL